MRTPKHIALIAAVALTIPILVSRVLTSVYGLPSSPAMIPLGILSCLMPGSLVWVGTYLGARWAAPHERTIRLAQILGVWYFIVGMVLILPIKTHAVLLEMPSASSAGPLDFIGPLAIPVGVPLLMLVAPIVLTRGVAMFCDRQVRNDG